MAEKATLKVKIDADTLHQFMMKAAGRWGLEGMAHHGLEPYQVAEEVALALDMYVDDAPAGMPARRK